MGDSTSIEVVLDDSVKDNPFFHGVKEIKINKSELFKYAIMSEEVPSHLNESDFDYLQNKVPYLEGLNSEFLRMSEDAIFNLSNDDRKKTFISEIVGVGIGLKYSVELLKVNPNKFKKIKAPIKGKYLDYSVIKDSFEYEIETKGTVKGSYSTMKNDIIAKKNNENLKKVHLRFGTISLLKKPNENTKSQCIIVDDPPELNYIENDDTFNTQLWSYGKILSYIIDSKYYNKYINRLSEKKINYLRINDKKFFAKYLLHGKEFYGECFDYRLIKKNINTAIEKYKERRNVFQLVTVLVGKTKIFIGLDIDIINAINKKDETFLRNYSSEYHFEDSGQIKKFLDIDGILIVKSIGDTDIQIKNIFKEEEVEKRIRLYSNLIDRKPHLCGAPCTSQDIKGKPCEIKTYREFCHFHR